MMTEDDDFLSPGWDVSTNTTEKFRIKVQAGNTIQLPDSLIELWGVEVGDYIQWHMDNGSLFVSLLKASELDYAWLMEPQDMIDTSKFLGLNETAARALAAEAGLQVNVTPAAPTMLTNAMQMNRLTLEIQGGFVTAARIG